MDGGRRSVPKRDQEKRRAERENIISHTYTWPSELDLNLSLVMNLQFQLEKERARPDSHWPLGLILAHVTPLAHLSVVIERFELETHRTSSQFRRSTALL